MNQYFSFSTQQHDYEPTKTSAVARCCNGLRALVNSASAAAQQVGKALKARGMFFRQIGGVPDDSCSPILPIGTHSSLRCIKHSTLLARGLNTCNTLSSMLHENTKK